MAEDACLKILYCSPHDRLAEDLPTVFRTALESLGDLTVRTNTILPDDELSALIRSFDVFLTCRHSIQIPAEIAEEPGNLKLITATVGSLRRYVPRTVIAAGVPVCNWGDAPADEIAMGTLTLTLAVLSDLHHHIQERRRGGWAIDPQHYGGSLFAERVGLYGYGLIARRFRELLRPFDCQVVVYDPYVKDVPDDVEQVETLDDLFRRCRIVSIHAGLTAETRGSVTRNQLALMGNDGVIINTGRGAIIDQAALFDELKAGRLRAGLDVLDDPDELPGDHPARTWENLILTGHQIHLGWPRHGAEPDRLTKAQSYAISNIDAVRAGDTLQWRISAELYDRMT